MHAVELPECVPVGKNRAKASQADPAYSRIELLAEPDWVQLLDEYARRLGLSRSAYIRMACNNQMNTDRISRHEQNQEG